MHRKKFISLLSGALIIPHMNTFSQLKRFTDDLEEQDRKMPVLFIGHGSPMNGIEDNEFSRGWSSVAKDMPVPKAVLVVSAHWFTRGTRITAMDFPKTIHDFGGFPEALFKVEYPAPGDPQLASQTSAMVKTAPVVLDYEWGLDHGEIHFFNDKAVGGSITMTSLKIGG